MIHFIWLDLETGGLNGPLPSGELGMSYYPILEIGIIITDNQLNPVGEPLRIVVFQDEQALEKLSEWALNQHTESGLLKEVRESGTTLADAEQMIINHLQANGVQAYDRKAKTGGIMAGNSIHFDRDFIQLQMPALDQYLHYRQLDISALALAFSAWCPEIAGDVNKAYLHRGLDDIRESIAEAAIYRDHIHQQMLKLQQLTPSIYMLDQIAKINGRQRATLEAVAELRSQRVVQDVHTWLAIDALTFEAGDWSLEKQLRHLNEQIQLAVHHLRVGTNPHPVDYWTVSAGKYEGDPDNPKNIKYASDKHYTFDAALADYMEHRNYQWCQIEYKGIGLTAFEIVGEA